MGTLIKQELYKLNHKKGTWLALAFMVVVQIGFAVLSWRYPKFFGTSMLVMNNYVGGMLVDFIMIASAASMIAMEFQYGTIKQLLISQVLPQPSLCQQAHCIVDANDRLAICG
jgi:ABC-2 type transport system permease protein